MGVHKLATGQNVPLTKNHAKSDPRSIATLSKLAEDHVEAGEFDVAKACLISLYSRRRTYTKDHGVLEAKDSWFIRACFTHARVLTHQNKDLKGKALVEEAQRAMSVALQGIQLAKESKRYYHLVYNGSVYFWHAARLLMRKHTWEHVHVQLGQVLAAVKTLSGHIQWKATLSAAMAQCSAAIGKIDECNQHADAAVTFNSQGDNSQDLLRAMTTLKVHVNEGNPKAKSADPKDASPQTLADLTVQRVLSQFLSGAPARAAIEAAYKKLDPDPESPPEAVSLLHVARLGFAAVISGDEQYGMQLGQRARSGKDPCARAWGEFITAHVNLEAAVPQSGKGSCKITKGDVSKLCSALEELAACLQAFLATDDVAGIHASCSIPVHSARFRFQLLEAVVAMLARMDNHIRKLKLDVRIFDGLILLKAALHRDIWNAGLTLLQHNLRQRVKPAFQAASSALQSCASPLHDLRTRLHIELAKCNMDDDQMAVALEDAQQANALDYSVDAGKAAVFHLERPWDRHLQPLFTTLRVRHSATYEAPVVPEEKAALFTQRARECRNPATCAEFLHRAIKALQETPMLQPVYTAPPGDAPPAGDDGSSVDTMSPDARFQAARQLTELWAAVVKTAWGLHLHEIVLLAAPHVSWLEWEPATDREMAQLQCQCSYYEADAAVLALVKQGKWVEEAPPDSQPATEPESGVRTPAKSITQLQYIAQERLLWGIRQAAALDLPWAVANGAVYCWNAHLPAMQRGRYAQVGEVLLQVANVLVAVDSQHIPQKLLRNLTVAAMKAAKHLALLGKVSVNDSGTKAGDLCLRQAEDMHAAAAAALSPPGLTEADQGRLKAALALAEASVAKLPSVPCQDLMEMVVQLQLCLGMPVTALPTILPEQRIVAQVLQSIGEINAGSKPFKEAKAALLQSISALGRDSSSNSELWVKLARCALGCGCFSQAIIAARNALEDTTTTPQALSLAATQPSTRAGAPSYQQFWCSSAAIICSQATVAIIRPPTQALPTQTEILQQALWYSALAAALASSLSRADVVTAAAQCALNAACVGTEFTTLRASLTEPLLHICTTLNKFRSTSGLEIAATLHSRLTAMCCACLLSAGRGADAAAAAREWQKPPAHPSHSYVWAWLIEVTRVAEAPVEEIMDKLGMYGPVAQAPLWVARSAAANGSQEQQKALDYACRMASQDPLISAQVHVQYCEWLLCCRGSILPTNGDNLEHLSQALVCLSSYHPPVTPPRPTDTGITSKLPSQSNRTTPHTPPSRVSTAGRRVSVTTVTEHAEAIIEGVHGAKRLDEALRVCVLWSLVAKDAASRIQWLLHGAHCAAKMATAVIDVLLVEHEPEHPSSSQAPANGQHAPQAEPSIAAAGNEATSSRARKDEQVPEGAPKSLQDWLLFPMSSGEVEKLLMMAAAHSQSPGSFLSGDECKSTQGVQKRSAKTDVKTQDETSSNSAATDSFTCDPLHCADRAFVWLQKLRGELQLHGCAAHCLPVLWLQVLLCATMGRRDGACIILSEISNSLQKLGLSHQAQSCQELAESCAVEVSRSMAAQISKHAQVNNALNVHSTPQQSSRVGKHAATLKAAAAEIMGRVAPGVEPDDNLTSEEPLLQAAWDLETKGNSKVHSSAVHIAAHSAQCHAAAIKRMTPRSRHQLLPTQHQHLLLQQATTLIDSSVGDVNHAFGLLRLAVAHSDARGDPDTKARCLLQLSCIEGLAGEPEHAVVLAQSAQQITKDTHVWLQAVIQYSRQRVLSGGGLGDAMAALQSALTGLKREAMAYSPPPAAMLSCMVPLYLEMAALHGAAHAEAVGCGQSGKAAQTEQLALLHQALSTARTYGTTLSHAQCTIALCDVLERAFNPSKVSPTQMDPRPHLEHLLSLLSDSEQQLAAFAPVAAPMESPVEALHPTCVMHARVLARLTRTHEAHAWADIQLADQDRRQKRGSFPLIHPTHPPTASAGEDGAPADSMPTPSVVPPSVVERFLDSTENAALAEQGGAATTEPLHEHYAVAYATSAVALCQAGTVPVDYHLLHGTLPLLGAERTNIEQRLMQADADTADTSKHSAAVSSDPPAGQDTSTDAGTYLYLEGAASQTAPSPAVSLDVRGFSDAHTALYSALSSAVRMHDWPRALLAADRLLQLSCVRPGATVLEQTEGQQMPHFSTPAEVLALSQSCRALVADSEALRDHAPHHHTACVLQRLRQLRKHPVLADCQDWCADGVESSVALHPDTQLLQSPVPADNAVSLNLGGSEPPSAQGETDCSGRKSRFVNCRAAAMLLHPVNALLNSFSAHVSVVVLDFDAGSSTLRACSLKRAPAESTLSSHQGPDSEYCSAVIDAAELESLFARAQRWEKALLRHMKSVNQQQQTPEASNVGGHVEAVATEQVGNQPTGLEQSGAEPQEPSGVIEPLQEQGDNCEHQEESLGCGQRKTCAPGVNEEQGCASLSDLEPLEWLRKEWYSLVDAMNTVFGPVATAFHHAAAPPDVGSAPPPTVEKGKKGSAPAPPAQPLAATVLLCVGGAMAQLPLEAMSSLQPAGAVCWDRGMHFAAARSELACLASESVDTTLLPAVNLAKAAYGVSTELESQFCSMIQQPFGPDWQGDVYRPADQTIAQEHHLVVAAQHEVVVSALTEDYCATVHRSTICCMDLTSTKMLVVLDRMTPVKEGCEAEEHGEEQGDAVGGASNTDSVRIKSGQRTQAVGCFHEMPFEGRMCMLLQRGVLTCVANRWPVPSDVGFSSLAGALKERDTELAVAVRNISKALDGAEPWQKYCLVVCGVPTVTVSTGAETASKGKKK